MIELASNYRRGPILLKDISSSLNVSLKYLGQITILLRNADLIKSARGPFGGYFLSKPPDKIRLINVLEATEGSLYLAECIEDPEICHHSKGCAARLAWEKASRTFMDVFRPITLKDMIVKNKRQERKVRT